MAVCTGALGWFSRPVLLGQQLSLLYYRRQCRAWDEVTPRSLDRPRRSTDSEAAAAVRLGVTAVLDLTAEFSEAKPFRTLTYLQHSRSSI